MAVGEIFLGIIAVAVTAMALMQVAALRAGRQAARRLEALGERLDAEIKPLVASLTQMTAETARAAGAVTTQVERLDRLFGDVGRRAEGTLSSAQQAITRPAREGAALVTGIRTAFSALRELSESARRRAAGRPGRLDEDESLFIG